MRLVLLILSALSVSPARALHVMVDPGHGGKDRGAVAGNLVESKLTLQISQQLVDLLNASPGFSASLTRTQDHSLSLEERAELAQKSAAEIFISIHVNSSPEPRAQGAEFYFQNQLPPDEESQFLAHEENYQQLGTPSNLLPLLPLKKRELLKPDVAGIIQDLQRTHRLQLSSLLTRNLADSWTGHRKSNDNVIRQAPFFLVSNVIMPSTLVEVGYITNPKEAQQLQQQEQQKKWAQDLVEGLKNYKRVVDKPL